jgi:hypothetical protein
MEKTQLGVARAGAVSFFCFAFAFAGSGPGDCFLSGQGEGATREREVDLRPDCEGRGKTLRSLRAGLLVPEAVVALLGTGSLLLRAVPGASESSGGPAA